MRTVSETSEMAFSSVQSLSRVRLFATPWIAARQASLSITNPRSSLRLTSIESVMPSSHLILCRPILLLPAIPPSIRVFSNESTLRMRWPKYWSFSFSIIPSKEWTSLVTQMGKVSVCNAGDPGLIPGLGRSPGEGNGSPLQYSCLENPMDGGAWWATVHGVAKNWTQLSDFTSLHFTSLPKKSQGWSPSEWLDLLEMALSVTKFKS